MSFSFIFQVMDPFVPLTNIITATWRILVTIVYVRGTLGSYYFQSETTGQPSQANILYFGSMDIVLNRL